MTRGPVVRGLGVLSAWGRGLASLPDDARAAAAGRTALSLGRLAREGEAWRRTTREGLIAVSAVEAALEDAGADASAIAGPDTALVYVTAAAYGASNRRFIEGRGGGIRFAETAPAVVSAEVSIAFGACGPYAILLGGPPATLRAIHHAAALIESAACARALVTAVEIFEECTDLYARARRLTALPVVEAAACLWLEPGGGVVRIEPGPPRQPNAGLRRRLGETFSVEPLVALDFWRRSGGLGTLEMAARWRGQSSRLIWTGATLSPAEVA